MRFVSALFVLACMAGPARPALAAEPASESLPSAAPALLDLDVSHGLRLSYEPITMGQLARPIQASVFTSMYWTRAEEQKAELAERFGLHWAYGLALDTVGYGTPQYARRSPLGYPEAAHWNAKAVAGLQFERRDLLLAGDRFSLRSTSDLQTLLREAGMARTPEEIDMLSLLGWRARSSLVWELGDPNREIQWQLSARLDRRAYSQASTANFSLLRRF